MGKPKTSQALELSTFFHDVIFTNKYTAHKDKTVAEALKFNECAQQEADKVLVPAAIAARQPLNPLHHREKAAAPARA